MSDRVELLLRQIRIPVDDRDRLIRLKRYTRIDHWNILCRWAFCRSLSEPTPPSPAPLPPASNIEISWHVFAGPWSDIFIALLRQRCHEDGLPPDDKTVAEQFRLHLHRGIAYLSTDGFTSIDDLIRSGTDAATTAGILGSSSQADLKSSHRPGSKRT